jgi:leader peptidase (prepilin peptidase) / N-methyltransferase
MIYRIDKKINLLIPRSFCEFCGKTLNPVDAVPFLNFIILKGKSRCCKFKLPGKYFISETISGIVFVILFLSPMPGLFSIPVSAIIILMLAYFFYLKK